MGEVIKAQCKVCGNNVPVDQFRLHFKYKQMVCPSCYTGKTEKKLEEKKKIENKPKPLGWDAEDEYLERVAKQRSQEQQSQFSKIPGTNQVRCKCLVCKYNFKYDPFRKTPRTCPYCNSEVPKLKTFNLL